MTAPVKIAPLPEPNAQLPPDTWKIERVLDHWTCDEHGNWRQEKRLVTKTARGLSDRPVEKP